jgi:beta-mannosidase
LKYNGAEGVAASVASLLDLKDPCPTVALPSHGPVVDNPAQDIDELVGRPAKLNRLLALAQRAHVNLLRVWGGGLTEKESFYNRCDELGLMVWQEFIQSSSGIENVPPADPEFVALMQREAEQIIPRKRNHPSLVIWCGGNELIGPDDTPLNEAHPLIAALQNTVTHLGLPASPSGRTASNTLASIEHDPTALHDVHGPWEYQGVVGQYTLSNAGVSLLHSEFGVEASLI